MHTSCRTRSAPPGAGRGPPAAAAAAAPPRCCWPRGRRTSHGSGEAVGPKPLLRRRGRGPRTTTTTTTTATTATTIIIGAAVRQQRHVDGAYRGRSQHLLGLAHLTAAEPPPRVPGRGDAHRRAAHSTSRVTEKFWPSDDGGQPAHRATRTVRFHTRALRRTRRRGHGHGPQRHVAHMRAPGDKLLRLPPRSPPPHRAVVAPARKVEAQGKPALPQSPTVHIAPGRAHASLPGRRASTRDPRQSPPTTAQQPPPHAPIMRAIFACYLRGPQRPAYDVCNPLWRAAG